MMHGAGPYIIAIAIIYASPTVIVALKVGKKEKKGSVINARVVSQIQPLSTGSEYNFHPAHRTIGNASNAMALTYTFSFDGSSAQFIARYRIQDY